MERLRDDARRVLEFTYPDSKFLTSNTKPDSEGWFKFN